MTMFVSWFSNVIINQFVNCIIRNLQLRKIQSGEIYQITELPENNNSNNNVCI